ncbi:MAG: ABC transporter permease [Holophaga sp.]|nr:ABC transporter permease [Holophaga sp.]
MRALWLVTVWEFRRYFKWKQELMGLLAGILVGGLFMGGSALVTRTKARQRAVVGVVDPVGLGLQSAKGITFEAVTDSIAAEARVGKGTLAGLLTVESSDSVRLLVAKDPPWQKELEQALAKARLAWKLRERGLSPAEFEGLVKPPTLNVVRHAEGRPAVGQARMIAGISILAIQLMAVMGCFALFFTNITGEKQARVTEQLVTAIPAQTWMDGKILAFSLHGLKSVVTLVFWGLLAALGALRFAGSPILADLGALSPFAWIGALSFIVLGLLFWSAFYAGLAATIDDPNHSARSSVMLLPIMPVVFSMMLLKLPDALLSRVLSWFPITSMGMMPLRVVQGSAGPWEALGSALLLLGSFLVLRRLAGRVFSTSMLLYGQEPSWGNIWRMLRAR